MQENPFQNPDNPISEETKAVNAVCESESSEVLQQLIQQKDVQSVLTKPGFTENRKDFLRIITSVSTDKLLILKSYMMIKDWTTELAGENITSFDAQKFVIKLRQMSAIDQDAEVELLQKERMKHAGKKYLKDLLRKN